MCGGQDGEQGSMGKGVKKPKLFYKWVKEDFGLKGVSKKDIAIIKMLDFHFDMLRKPWLSGKGILLIEEIK